MAQYKTSDIVLAATLKVHGYVLHSIEMNGSKGIFIFDGVDLYFISEFNLGKTTVEPVAFNNAIRQLTTSVRRML